MHVQKSESHGISSQAAAANREEGGGERFMLISMTIQTIALRRNSLCLVFMTTAGIRTYLVTNAFIAVFILDIALHSRSGEM